MPIDIRQETICMAGDTEYPLVSATVMDDYQSMSGLMLTRGEGTLVGSAPALGAVISFTGVPRTLKVMGVSASPLEGLYTVKFGCPITLALQAQDVDFTRRIEEDERVIPEWYGSINKIPQLTLGELFGLCCSRMGLGSQTLGDAGTAPIFVADNPDKKYEFTGTYASTAAAILSSLGRYGYYEDGLVKHESVLQGTSTAITRLTKESVIATGPGGSAATPAGRYGVSYGAQGVKRWRREVTKPKEICSENTTEPEPRFIYYSFDTDVVDQDNDPVDQEIEYSYSSSTKSCSYLDEKGREFLSVDTVVANGYLDNYASTLGAAGFSASAAASAGRACTQVTTTAREFDLAGHVVSEVMEVTQEDAVLGSSLNLPFARPAELLSDGTTIRPAQLVYSLPGSASTFVAERVERTAKVDMRDVVLTTRRWLAAGYTPEGQQAAAEAAKDTRSGARIGSILFAAKTLVEQPVELQRLTGAAKQWNAELTEAEKLSEAEADAGVSENSMIVYGVVPVAGFVSVNGQPGFPAVNLSLPFMQGTKELVAEVQEQDDGSLKLKYTKEGRTTLLDTLAKNYATAYNDLAVAGLYSVNIQVPLSKAPASVCSRYQADFNGSVVSGVSTGATFQLTADGGLCSFDLLPNGTLGSVDGSSWVGAVGPVPPLPPLVTDPETGELIYDDMDVILVPIEQPLSPEVEGGIRLGVEAFSITGPATKTTSVETGLALGIEADSELVDPNIRVGITLGLRLGVLEDPAPATYTQSSVYAGTTAASFANMTDNSFTNTGAATNTAATEFVRADLGNIRFITTVYVGTATSNIPGGWSKSYTENRDIEISDNGTSWTLVTSTGTFASDGIYPFTVNAPARYLRIKATSDYLAVSELRIAAI